ncbi:PLAC8 family-domain-containing protein [Thermothelomyces heterothallicus CBS 202.75]|uniref:PLAC8 family-domain-containing protein n=1 Tax=Thermothelomyces heterothallicus CBS 202.75 TaxID=1149848 RepID=UPI003741F15D
MTNKQGTRFKQNDWQDDNGLMHCCGDCGTCMLGCFVPCVLINKTQNILEDPSEHPSACGSFGGLSCFLSLFGLTGVTTCIQRRQIRLMYGIEGNCCCDALITGCLPCCAVIQNYKEVDFRRDNQNAWGIKDGYKRQLPMQHPMQYPTRHPGR